VKNNKNNKIIVLKVWLKYSLQIVVNEGINSASKQSNIEAI